MICLIYHFWQNFENKNIKIKKPIICLSFREYCKMCLFTHILYNFVIIQTVLLYIMQHMLAHLNYLQNLLSQEVLKFRLLCMLYDINRLTWKLGKSMILLYFMYLLFVFLFYTFPIFVFQPQHMLTICFVF